MTSAPDSGRGPRPVRAAAPAPKHWVDHDAPGTEVGEPDGWTRTLFAVAEVMFADAYGPPDPQRLRWLCDRTRELADAIGGKGVLAYRASLLLIDWVGPVFIGRLPPLTRLDFDARVEALEALEKSPFGMALLAVKALTSMSYFEHPEVADEIGFDGRCFTSARGGER